jgi:hypothetical protein
MIKMQWLMWWGAGLLLCGAAPARADQVLMQNGDTYKGTVLAVTTNAVVLQSPNLGRISLPRAKAAAVFFGDRAGTNTVPDSPAPALQRPRPAAAQTKVTTGLGEAMRGIRGQTNLLQAVQTQMLGDANPEATAKFNELVEGLSTGKMDMAGLRAEAAAAAEQLRSLKKELGADAGGELDTYLAILEKFLKETPPQTPATNSNR